jgi:hypothetical protein
VVGGAHALMIAWRSMAVKYPGDATDNSFDIPGTWW